MVVRHLRRLFLSLLLVLLGWLPAATVQAQEPRRDAYGDPLPPGALVRLGTERFRVEGFSRAAVLSPDGKLVAVAVQSNQVCLLDATSGKEVRRLPSRLIGPGHLIFSPDGKYLAVGSLQGVQVLDAQTGAAVVQLGRTGQGTQVSLAFSADGKLLAHGSDGFRQALSATVHDVSANKTIGTFASVHNHRLSVALSADGKLLATWGQHLNTGVNPAGNQNLSRVVQLWDVGTGKELKQFQVEGHAVTAAVFAPDGKHLAVAESTSTLSVWDVASGKQVRRTAARRGTGHVLSYSPDGKLLVGGTVDGAVQVWEADSGKRVALSQGHERGLSSVAFPADDKVLATGINGNAVHVWEVPGAERSPRQAHSSSVTGLAFRRHGKEFLLLSASTDGIRSWELPSGKAVRHLVVRADADQLRTGMQGLSVDISPDGKNLVCGVPHMQGLQVRELERGEPLFDLDCTNDVSQGLTRVFAANGKTFATLSTIFTAGKRAQVVRVWDLGSGQQQGSFETTLGEMSNTLALSGDGRVVAAATTSFNRGGAGGQTCEVRAWDVAGGKQLCRFTFAQGSATALAFSPDGSLLAAGGQGAPALGIWDTASGLEVRTLPGAVNQNVGKLLFSADGRTLAAATTLFNGRTQESKLLLLEAVSGKVRGTFHGHRGTITALAFAPDGRTLASGSSDTTVLLWDLAAQQEGDRPVGKLEAQDLEGLWTELDDADAEKAYKAMLRLSEAPQEAVALLSKHLAPVKGKKLEGAEIEKLIADLGSDTFQVREKASRDLALAGRQARPALLKALQAQPILEQQRRLEKLLEAMARTKVTPEMVRQVRALEVLERVGTDEARQVLQRLAEGHPDAWLTVEAQGALRRLEQRARP